MDYKQLDREKLVRAGMYVAREKFNPQYYPLEKFGENWADYIINDPDWIEQNPISVSQIMAVYNAV